MPQAFVIVQRKVYVWVGDPVNVAFRFLAPLKLPPTPATIVHWPLPTVGALPFKVANWVVTLVWSKPAFAVVGAPTNTNVNSSAVLPQALAIVQRST